MPSWFSHLRFPGNWLRRSGAALAAFVCLWAGYAAAQPGSAVMAPAKPAWVNVPRIQGHLVAADVGLVINSNDPNSVAVGEYYARQRGIPPEQVVRVALPVRPTLTAAEFEQFNAQVKAAMGPQVQALALAWAQPYAVECNAITAALTVGYQPELCSQTCATSRPSVLFNHPTVRPFTDLGVRPSMLLAGRTVAQATALIDRGVAADRQLGKRGWRPPAWCCCAPRMWRAMCVPLGTRLCRRWASPIRWCPWARSSGCKTAQQKAPSAWCCSRPAQSGLTTRRPSTGCPVRWRTI